MMTFDLDTPVGRRAMEAGLSAANAGEYYGVSGLLVRMILHAALAVLMDDTCPRCRGRGQLGGATQSAIVPVWDCPDCVNGKVTPALVEPER